MNIENILGKYYTSLREEPGIDSISISFHFEWDEMLLKWILIVEASNKFVKFVIKEPIGAKKMNVDSVRLSISNFVQQRGDQLVDNGVAKNSFVGWVSKLLGYENMHDRIEDMLIFVRA